ELYLNCIEYGPGIWGLTAAAKAYYNKPATELAAAEGLYLMAIKPYPKHGWYNAKRNRWRSNWVRRMRHVFRRVHEAGAIDDATFAAAGPDYRPVFAGIHPPPVEVIEEIAL
ncbi:MAG: monofunctional biosynthetic peptidoglycan transglycosylase, partial [Myxococcota bacterium]